MTIYSRLLRPDLIQIKGDVASVVYPLDKLSNGHIPPEDACNTYRALYAYLEEFAVDTKMHVHLEKNIIFSNVLQLEAVPQKS